MWPEPFGLVALESMACGVPVVAHAIGGLSELVQDGETGFLITPGDRKSIENKVAELVTNDNQWLTLSRNARRRAEEFDWSNIVSRYYLSLFHLEDNQTNEREDCS
jgi:glycosyltransferase involved in cell wall biosynthesis